MAEPQRIVSFSGPVSCRREAGVLGLTLIGQTAERPAELVSLAFPGGAPSGLPEVLEDVSVDSLDAHRVRISSGPKEWVVQARTWHLHGEVASAFYQAIPPRPVPWRKRLFWRLVLSMMTYPAGKRLLLMLRRR